LWRVPQSCIKENCFILFGKLERGTSSLEQLVISPRLDNLSLKNKKFKKKIGFFIDFVFSAFSLESNALKGPLWLAGWPAGPLACCLKNSAEEARRDFGFFALNSCYFVGVRNVFSFLKLPTKT